MMAPHLAPGRISPRMMNIVDVVVIQVVDV
jgi:hypothetical protein